MTIGYRLDCDDECEATPTVGEGCASLTASDDLARALEASYAIAARLRALGATEVRVGDVHAKFPPLVERLDVGGLPVERPMRQVNKPRDPDELTPEEMEYVPGA